MTDLSKLTLKQLEMKEKDLVDLQKRTPKGSKDATAVRESLKTVKFLIGNLSDVVADIIEQVKLGHNEKALIKSYAQSRWLSADVIKRSIDEARKV